MSFVASNTIEIFSLVYPSIKEDWGKVALKWASNCPVHHLACRSFQVFRTLLSTLEPTMLADMLARLSNTVADDSTEVQTFTMEILTTLKAIIAKLAPQDLMEYPCLFWATCACLNSVHEQEFLICLGMLEQIMSKIDLSDRATATRLLESQPLKWNGGFNGLLDLLYKGIRSSGTIDVTLKVIENLVILTPNRLIGDASGLLFVLLANAPRYMEHNGRLDQQPQIGASAKKMCQDAEAKGHRDVAIVLQSYLNRAFRTEDDFFSQLLQALKPIYFPDYDYDSLTFLMGLLTNPIPWFKIKVMQMLRILIPEIDMKKSEIANKGPDLIGPLLRLLQTEYCQDALAVLDHVMSMRSTPDERVHLRMSMMQPNSSRASRKEYEGIRSLYGIPEPSGWSIPTPAMHMSITRQNVHAVFYSCVPTPDTKVPIENTTPRIELVEEELTGSYFADYRTATMMSEDTRVDQSLGPADIVTRLNRR